MSLFGKNLVFNNLSFNFGQSNQQQQQENQSNPLISYDYVKKNGIETRIQTFHNCITALKDYENKSLEELRWEDYRLGKKHPEHLPLSTPLFQITSNQNLSNRPVPTDGTSVHKYKPTEGMDLKPLPMPSIETKLTHICAMLEYENLSPEELRFCDYKNGLKTKPVKIENKKGEIKSEIKVDDETGEFTSCPICLETILKLKKDNIKLNVTMCGHVICKVCTDRMLQSLTQKRSTKIECPSCRKNLNRNEIHQIFI